MLLFTPGPTPVPQIVRDAMSKETIHHRTPEFEAIFAEARGYLFELFGMQEVIMLACSGTGAMEAAVTNLCKTRLLNVNSGKFGERFGKIALACGLLNSEIKNEWDTPVTVEEILEALRANPDTDAVAIQISESAGGLRHPVEEVAKAIKEFNENIIVIADGITAVGVEPIDVTHIDCLIAGSQKALMLPPGMAVLGLSQRAIEKMGSGKGYYFNLVTEMKKQRENTTAWTAPTTLIIGLLEVLKEIKRDGGLVKLYRETKLRSEATRAALQSLGLHLYPKVSALSMTTVDDADASKIRNLLKEHYMVNVAGGQDHLKGKIFRINHMGLIPVYEAIWVVNAIELIMDSMGRRPFDGTASRVFSEIYFAKKES